MARTKRKGERPDGLIQVALDIGYWPDGRRRRKYFYGHTRTEANAKKQAYLDGLNAGSKFRPDITVAEWVDIFKTTYRQNVDDAYLGNDDVPYNRLVQRLGKMRVIDVTEADLQNALNAVAGMSYSTVDKYRHAMNRVFERARKNKIISDNPAEELILPRNTKGTHRALATWEIQHIMSHWNEPGLHAGLWVILMLLAGLRRSEMMGLDWSCVDMERRVLAVQQVAVIYSNQTRIKERTKTSAGLRFIPICQPLYEALDTVPLSGRKGLVCLSAHGRQLSGSAVSRGLTTFCDVLERILNGEPPFQHGRRTDLEAKAGKLANADRQVFRFRCHDLRHTFATLLYDGGIDVKAAQYFLGHSNIKMTLDLYTHLSQERERDSRQRLVTSLENLLDKRLETPFNLGNGGKMVVVDGFSADENGETP